MTVSYTYDNSGNQQTATDALGHTTTTLYDALDRATTLISAVGGITTITYDIAGRETSLEDPAGNTTSWLYDANDRVTTVVEPNGATISYVYDNAGELKDTTDQDGRRVTFTYDKDGIRIGESWVNGSGSAIYLVTYTYDADHDMTGVTDPYATQTFTYDKDGRVVTIVTSGPGTGQPTVTLTYSYDQIGDETSVSDSLSNQGVISYTYNLDQEVTQTSQSFGGTVGPQITFGYDYASRLTSTSRQIGTSSTATEVNTSVGYDSANRVVTIADSQAVYSFFGGGGWSTTPLATQVYSYDNASRVTAETDKEGTASFTYDNANELTGVTGSRSESYSYDLNGNRTGAGYHTTVMNEMTTSPGHTYTYDNAGNLISDNNGTSVTTYTYDYENRLTSVTSVTTGGTVVVTYTYNALGQRIGFKDGGTQTWTVYDGPGADANPYADFTVVNGSPSLAMRYLFGPTVVNGAVTTGILARTSSGGTTAWYLTDKLDSVRDIVDTSGNELDHLVYDSFGNVVTETSVSMGDRFEFAGMEYDSATGQYYDRARYYDAGAGRFMSPDSLRFKAGDADLYRYVGNEPGNATDPSGHQDPGPSMPSPAAPSKSLPQPVMPRVDTEVQLAQDRNPHNKPNPRGGSKPETDHNPDQNPATFSQNDPINNLSLIPLAAQVVGGNPVSGNMGGNKPLPQRPQNFTIPPPGVIFTYGDGSYTDSNGTHMLADGNTKIEPNGAVLRYLPPVRTGLFTITNPGWVIDGYVKPLPGLSNPSYPPPPAPNAPTLDIHNQMPPGPRTP